MRPGGITGCGLLLSRQAFSKGRRRSSSSVRFHGRTLIAHTVCRLSHRMPKRSRTYPSDLRAITRLILTNVEVGLAVWACLHMMLIYR